MANGGETADDAHDSAWATGSVPVPEPPPPPPEAPRRHPASESPSSPSPRSTEGEPHLGEEIVGHTDDDDTPLGPVDRASSDRRRWIAISAVVVVALLAVGSIVVSRSDDEPDSNSPATTVPTSTSPESTEAPTTTQGSTTTSVVEGTAPGAIERLDLPPMLSSQPSPTEIVALTDEGDLHTISLPSGRVRTTPLLSAAEARSAFGSSSIIVTPDAAALAMNDGEVIIAPRTGQAAVGSVTADDEFGSSVNLIGWRRIADGSTRFRAVVFSGNDGFEVRLISPSGTVEGVEDNDPSIGPWREIQRPDGRRIVNDAGGAYLIGDDDSATRLVAGTVLAASFDHLLVRECDADRQCSMSVLDERTQERVAVDSASLPTALSAFPGLTLAPDGAAVAVIDPPTGELRIVDLASDEETRLRATSWNQAVHWAAGSDGVFYSSVDEPGVHFVSRSGEVVRFAAELGTITQLGVRWPDEELVDPAPAQLVTSEVPTEAPIPLSFVALGELSGLHHIDLVEQQATTWQAPSLRGIGTGWLFPAGDAVTALAPDGSVGAVIRADGFEQFDDPVAARGPRLPAGDGHYWTQLGEGSDDFVALHRVDPTSVDTPLSGRNTLRMAASTLVGTDGGNLPIVDVGGDVYVAADGELQRLTTGSLLAISAERAVVRECDEAGACETWMTDRLSGSREPLGWELPVAALEKDGERLVAGTEISPDGTVIAVDLQMPSGIESTFVDLVNQTLTPTSDRHDSQPIVWSADGNFAVYHARREVMLYDRERNVVEPLALPPSIGEVRAIAPGLNAPAPDG